MRLANVPIAHGGSRGREGERVPTRFVQKYTVSTEPLAKLPGDWGWAQSSALLVNTIALDRRLDILSGEPAARRR